MRNILFILAYLILTGCSVTAERIVIEELDDQLQKLIAKELEYNFFGITSNGIDCIYFVDNDGKINIEYEVLSAEQIPYISQLESFARVNDIKFIQTTYGNKSVDGGVNPAPVYRLETNSGILKSSQLGKKIMQEVFNGTASTTYEVVP